MSDFTQFISSLFENYGETYWDYFVGCVFWAVAAILPFRAIKAKKNVLWDAIGLVTAYIFASIAEEVLDAPAAWAMDTPLIGQWYGLLTQLHPALIGVLYLVLSDMLVYWSHRSMHSRQLWHIHAWHHSPENVYWISGLRGSLPDTLMLYAPYTIAFVIFPVLDASTLLVAMVIVATINPFIHSNLRIPFAREVERVFVTPRYHFAHHSANKVYGNSNYGKLFTWWDRLFGTYTNPDTVPADQPLGLGYEASQWKMALGIRAAPDTDPRQTNVMSASTRA